MKYCLKSTKIITNTAEVIQKWLNCVAAVDILGSHYVQQSLCATALAEIFLQNHFHQNAGVHEFIIGYKYSHIHSLSSIFFVSYFTFPNI